MFAELQALARMSNITSRENLDAAFTRVGNKLAKLQADIRQAKLDERRKIAEMRKEIAELKKEIRDSQEEMIEYEKKLPYLKQLRRPFDFEIDT